MPYHAPMGVRALGWALCASVVLAAAAPACSANHDLGFGEGADASSGAGAGLPLDQQIHPAPGGVRLLGASQYLNSVKLVLGPVAAAAASPPALQGLHGFKSIGAAQLALPATSVIDYETSARNIADAVIHDAPSLTAIVPCQPSGPSDAACLAQMVSKLGRLLWRHPLSSEEVNAIVTIGMNAAKIYDRFDKGVAYALLALLQAPEFLYIVEIGEPDPDAPVDAPRRRLTQAELAARLSFFLIDTTPDTALLDLADKKKLDGEDAIRAAAKSLLARPEAKLALGSFYDEVFRLGDIDTTAKDAATFPDWTPDLQKSMHASARAMLDDIVWARDADAREMISADYAWIDATLAPLYGVPAPQQSGLVKVKLPAAQERRGLLGSPAIMSLYSHAARSSPTKRGVFIRRTLLCDTVPNPPNNVVPKLPDNPNDGLTAKQLLQQHAKDPNCKGCHAFFDSLGWSLEKYDAIGKFRTTDKGQPIDTKGDSANIGTFSGPAELADLLYKHPQVPDCMVRNLYRNSMGHLETDGEEPAVNALHVAFEGGGFKVKDLLVEIAANPGFRLVGDPK